jgi:hypothetical protein
MKRSIFAAILIFSVTFASLAQAGSTSASVLTHPPLDMTGINTQQHLFSGGMDPEFVTLGPKEGLHPELGSYPGKIGVNYELPLNSPILAPLDSKFVGFNNRNSDARNGMDGTLQVPFDDLQLCFESTSKDWPGLSYCFYHLRNSPLLQGININKLCSNAKLWPGPLRAEGRQFYAENDGMQPRSTTSKSCKALLGKNIKRGSIIAYAGTVGSHSQAPITVKVRDSSINPTVINGDPFLHWVQSDVFFYWKCYSPKVIFELGVLAYPFECGGYKVPAVQRSLKFKYLK